MCAAKSLRKAKSRLPLWGRWTRVSEDGEGKLPAAPSHGLCGSAGGLPSQSRLPPCRLPRRGSQVGTQPEVCRKPSLASPFGGGAPAGGGEGSPPPARTCAGLLMSTSGASCHGRELTAEALRRPGKALRCFPSFFSALRAHKVKFKVEAFLKKSFTKKLYPLRAAFSYSPSVHLRISSKNAWPYFCSLAWPTPGTSSNSAGVRGW